MRFSVIIPTKEIADYFIDALPYYDRQKFKDFEIIVLSNIKENKVASKKNIRLVETGNVSPAKKRNLGAKLAKGEILAFIDDDAYPPDNWLEIADKELKNKEIVAIGGPSLVPPKATFFQRVSNKVYELSSSKTGPRYGLGQKMEIDDWPTCNFFVRKKSFDRVGGFDPNYWGGEDTQLCYSLKKSGGKIIYEPSLGVFHHPRKSLRNHLRQSFFWGMWRGFFMKKHSKQSIQAVFFIPPLFLFGLFFGAIVSIFSEFLRKVYFLTLAVYVCYLLYLGLKTKDLKLFFPVMYVSFLSHIVYGAGFWKGLLAGKEGPIKRGMHPTEKLVTKK